MKKIIPFFVSVCICSSFFTAVAANDGNEYANNEIFVMYKNGENDLLAYDDYDELKKEIERLTKREDVDFVQPNYTYKSTSSDPYYKNQWALENDGSFFMEERKNEFPVYDNPFGEAKMPKQWIMPNDIRKYYGFSQSSGSASDAVADIDINTSEAWDIYDGGKREVIVAMIDTGIDVYHEDMNGRFWINEKEIAGNGIDDDGNGYVDDVNGWNFYNNNNTIYNGTEDSHGTHGAGTIVANRNNNIGISGIVPGDKVKIMPIKALGGNEGTGSTASIIRAIKYAESNGATICNLSLGTSVNDSALYKTIAESEMLFVVAAGNNGENSDISPCYPASYDLDNIISVANLSCDGKLNYASNYGVESVDIAAPGSFILSTTPENGYGFMSGTSMAAPMVTAAAAMVYSYYEDISLAEVKELLLCTAKKTNGTKNTVKSGGMLDLGAAMKYDPESINETESKDEDKSNYEFSAPEISVKITKTGDTDYLTVTVTDTDNDILKCAYLPGKHTAEDFKTERNVQEFHLGEDNTAIFKAVNGMYTFYAADEQGLECIKTIQIVNAGNKIGHRYGFGYDSFNAVIGSFLTKAFLGF